MKYLGIIIMLGSILLSSCKLGYVPPSAHVAMIKEKNEANITASFGATSCDAQVAFSPANSFLLLADVSGTFSTGNASGGSASTQLGYNYNLGVGYYYLLDEKNLFEAIVGFGQGKYETNYRKMHVQPAIVFYNKKSRMAMSMRLTYVDFNKSMFVVDKGQQVSEYCAFMEPAYTLQAGSELIKFHSQLGLSVPISVSTNQVERFSIPFFINLGINVNIAPRKVPIKLIEIDNTDSKSID